MNDESLLGMQLSVLRAVRLPDGRVGDVNIRDGYIVHSSEAQAPIGGEGVLDAAGWRCIPAAAEPHAHLDKALTASRMSQGSGNDLIAAVMQWRELSDSIDSDDLRLRASTAMGRYLARGITSIRTHVDVLRSDDPLRGVRTLLELRDRVRGRMNLQVCLLANSEAPTWLLEEAIALGIDVLGGCPHLSPDPRLETARLLDLAQKYELPVDLHTDEQTDASEVDLLDLAQQVIAREIGTLVTASHCVRLGSLDPARLAPVLDQVKAAGIGIVTLPITNLYLQGWDATHLAPRGLTAVREIIARGIPLAAGGDNLRDPFNPVGRADPFETTSLLMTAGHLMADDALACVTATARSVMGLAPARCLPGDAADFMLVPDVDLGDILAGATDTRIVVHQGRVVAHTNVVREVELFSQPVPALHPTTVR